MPLIEQLCSFVYIHVMSGIDLKTRFRCRPRFHLVVTHMDPPQKHSVKKKKDKVVTRNF